MMWLALYCNKKIVQTQLILKNTTTILILVLLLHYFSAFFVQIYEGTKVVQKSTKRVRRDFCEASLNVTKQCIKIYR